MPMITLNIKHDVTLYILFFLYIERRNSISNATKLTNITTQLFIFNASYLWMCRLERILHLRYMCSCNSSYIYICQNLSSREDVAKWRNASTFIFCFIFIIKIQRKKEMKNSQTKPFLSEFAKRRHINFWGICLHTIK